MLRRYFSRPTADSTAGDQAESQPARDLSVVHSSFGRLRVHLPHWSREGDAEIAAEVLRMAGVTHAEASAITGNLLILFAPRETSAERLLEALPYLRAELPVPPPVLDVENEPPRTAIVVANPPGESLSDTLALPAVQPDYYVTGWARVLYQGLGWASVGLAVVGAITPGIPTAPFVVLAGYFFIRSSPEAHRWLRESRWFGPILRDWEEHRAVRRSVRNFAIGLIIFSMAFVMLIGMPITLTVTIVTLQLIGLVIVMSLRVIDPTEEMKALPAPVCEPA